MRLRELSLPEQPVNIACRQICDSLRAVQDVLGNSLNGSVEFGMDAALWNALS